MSDASCSRTLIESRNRSSAHEFGANSKLPQAMLHLGVRRTLTKPIKTELNQAGS